MVRDIAINTIAIKNDPNTKIKAQVYKQNFNSFLGAANASTAKGEGLTATLDALTSMSTAAGLGANQAGLGTNSQAVLAAAFSGFGAASPSLAGGSAVGASLGYPGMKYTETGGMLPGSSSSSVVPGTDYSQADMINTMNQNNLQLLELQAMMQSNMQAWNTKSNILSADHRARMAMIEKFTTR